MMPFLSTVGAFLCTVTAVHAPDATSRKVTGEVLVPAALASFEGRCLEIRLWEYDPRLADATATLVDELVVTDYAHSHGQPTRTAFTLREKVNGGQTSAGKAYYLTVFATQGEKRTHIGEQKGQPGLCRVWTDGHPNHVTLTLRAVAHKQPVPPTKQWSGSVAEEPLAQEAPACIRSAPAWAKLWTDWQLPGPAPAIDWAKELVVVTTTRGSRLRLALSLDDQGDLRIGGVATMDLRPGFRYVIATVRRDGVKSVQGQELPKR